MSDGSVVVDRRVDEASELLQIGLVVVGNVVFVDVDVGIAVVTLVFVQHPQHVCQQSDQHAELHNSPI